MSPSDNRRRSTAWAATPSCTESRRLTFRDSENGRIYRYRTEVKIGPRTGSANILPSLLGQDILQHWSLLHEPATGRLEATPSPADAAPGSCAVRVSAGYRALGVMEQNDIIRFWIGSHQEYDRLLRRG